MDWVGELYRVIKLISYGGTSRKLTNQFIAALDETITPSGAGSILTATVTLTDAQIIAGDPVVIIPATEIVNYARMPATIPKVIGAVGIQNTLAGAYDGLIPVTLGYGTLSDSNFGQSVHIDGGHAFSASGISLNTEKKIFGFMIGEATADQDIADNAVVVQAAFGATGGNPANTLKVIVYYVVIDT